MIPWAAFDGRALLLLVILVLIAMAGLILRQPPRGDDPELDPELDDDA